MGDRPTTRASRQEPTLGHSLPLSYRGAKLLRFQKALLGASSLGAVPTLPGARTGPRAAPGRGLAARGKQQLVVPAGTPHPRTGVSPMGRVSALYKISTRAEDIQLQAHLAFQSPKYHPHQAITSPLVIKKITFLFRSAPHRLTRGSIVPRSFILLPLRFRCVRFGHFSANTSSPPEILLSLSSS